MRKQEYTYISFLKDAYGDHELKQARGYTHPKTKVFSDGREILHGGDWRKRVAELRQRARGKCECWTILRKQHHPLCWGRGQHPHHIIKRWPVRDDRISNLSWLSIACHEMQDSRKIGGRK